MEPSPASNGSVDGKPSILSNDYDHSQMQQGNGRISGSEHNSTTTGSMGSYAASLGSQEVRTSSLPQRSIQGGQTMSNQNNGYGSHTNGYIKHEDDMKPIEHSAKGNGNTSPMRINTVSAAPETMDSNSWLKFEDDSKPSSPRRRDSTSKSPTKNGSMIASGSHSPTWNSPSMQKKEQVKSEDEDDEDEDEDDKGEPQRAAGDPNSIAHLPNATREVRSRSPSY